MATDSERIGLKVGVGVPEWVSRVYAHRSMLVENSKQLMHFSLDQLESRLGSGLPLLPLPYETVPWVCSVARQDFERFEAIARAHDVSLHAVMYTGLREFLDVFTQREAGGSFGEHDMWSGTTVGRHTVMDAGWASRMRAVLTDPSMIVVSHKQLVHFALEHLEERLERGATLEAPPRDGESFRFSAAEVDLDRVDRLCEEHNVRVGVVWYNALSSFVREFEDAKRRAEGERLELTRGRPS